MFQAMEGEIRGFLMMYLQPPASDTAEAEIVAEEDEANTDVTSTFSLSLSLSLCLSVCLSVCLPHSMTPIH